MCCCHIFVLREGANTNAERQANSTLNGHDISMTSKNFDSIRNDIKVLFPRSKVYFYGSQIYELTDDQSDLNVYIDLGEKKYIRFLPLRTHYDFILYRQTVNRIMCKEVERL